MTAAPGSPVARRIDRTAVLITGADLSAVPAAGQGDDAVLVRDGVVVALGDGRVLARDVAGPCTVVDAGGAFLLPGLTDSHTHFQRAAVLAAHFLDFDELAPASIDDVLAAVRRRAEAAVDGDWVQGDSLHPQRLREGRFPDRHELDAASPQVPVVLRGVGRHVVAANTVALRLAGIDADTVDPQGGRIERDPDGTPSGILHETAQLRLDANAADTVVPRISESMRVRALREGVQRLHRHGIVAIHEIPREPEQVSDWQRLREEDGPTIRVRTYIRGLGARTRLADLLALGIRGGVGDEWFRIAGVKFSIDGSVAPRNAMLHSPYPGTDHRGLQRIPDDELQEGIRLAHEANFQIAVHAIGPRAVDVALDAFAALPGAADGALLPRRHRIEHAYLPAAPGLWDRFRDLGIALSTQASFLEAEGDSWATVFGDDLGEGWMPVADAVAAGVHVQLNSDFPCSPLEPFLGMAAAVGRRSRSGRLISPSQAIDNRTAIALMTTAPAWTAFEESWRGAVAPGMAAELILVDRDPLRSPPDEFAGTEVLLTMLDGGIVHDVLGRS